ncbi:hypothetical protein CAPTEDRAFT_211035 [Capitella teleta]|uniref:Glycosyltransferase family 92 protein n=1 Tax=Capitella teleta TaxID=283909 RepID=R7VFZ0_CAPTE|nr:hypothetical protein CAPTEDRAFT_211035 [Capitella teleta]|eukprot:ELU14600.1 hypothetical protein CAPTEDRAFT_211035 [Capitella teleta]
MEATCLHSLIRVCRFRLLQSFFVTIAIIVVIQILAQFIQISFSLSKSTRHRWSPAYLDLPYADDAVLPEEQHEDIELFRDGRLNVVVQNGQIPPDPECGTTARRPKLAELRNGYWQVLQQDGEEVMASVAFFDERPIIGVLPWLRMHGITRHTPKTAKFCYIWYDGVQHPYITELVGNRTGRNYSFNHTKYVQNQMSCRLPTSHPIPTHVSVVVGSRCGNASLLIPVEYSPRTSWTHEFGVCVAIAFGTVAPEVFVEWAEFQRLFGVGEINIYDAGMTNMTKVFDYYKQQGLLRVFNMPPALNFTTYHTIKLSSPASLNDCMLRNTYRYRFMLVIDFDEFIVPRLHNNYSAMLDDVMRRAKHSEPHHTYTARNTYFFRDFPPDDSQPAYMRTAKYRTRLPPSGGGYAPKSFVDPRRCFSLFNHYCWVRFPNSGPSLHDMSTKLVLSHHYRKCGFGEEKCQDLMQKGEQDDVALTFKIPLKRRVERALSALGIKPSRT